MGLESVMRVFTKRFLFPFVSSKNAVCHAERVTARSPANICRAWLCTTGERSLFIT